MTNNVTLKNILERKKSQRISPGILALFHEYHILFQFFHHTPNYIASISPPHSYAFPVWGSPGAEPQSYPTHGKQVVSLGLSATDLLRCCSSDSQRRNQETGFKFLATRKNHVPEWHLSLAVLSSILRMHGFWLGGSQGVGVSHSF